MSKVYKTVLWLTLPLALLSAAVWIGECLNIFFSADEDMYSAQRISKALQRAGAMTLPFLFVCLAAGLQRRGQKAEPMPFRPDAATRLKLVKRYREMNAAALGIEKKIRRLWTFCGALLSPCLCLPIIYLGDRANFSGTSGTQINANMLDAAKYTLPYILAALLILAICLKIADHFTEKEIVLLQRSCQRKSAAQEEKGIYLGPVRAAILSAAAVLILHGIFNGSAADVLGKAAVICTECIGLG